MRNTAKRQNRFFLYPLVGCALTLLPSHSLATWTESGTLKYSVGLGTFENRAGSPAWRRFASTWKAILIDQLEQTGRFVVVGELEKSGKPEGEERSPGNDGFVQKIHFPTSTQETSPQLLLKGVVTAFRTGSVQPKEESQRENIGFRSSDEETEIHATLYVVDSETRTVITSKNVMGNSIDRKQTLGHRRSSSSTGTSQVDIDNVEAAMASALEEAVSWMISEIGSLPWRSSISAIVGDQIYIDRGSRLGVSKGMRMIVGELQYFRSPGTGEILDKIVTERARIEVVRALENTSVCRLISGDPATLSEGAGLIPESS